MRFSNSGNKSSGFTIVEVLVVIIIIGTLTGISALSYNDYKKTVSIAQIKSDLGSARTAMENARNFGNTYPSSVPSTFTASSGIILTGGGSADGKTYCIDMYNDTSPSIRYFITNTNNTPQLGVCPVALTAIGSITGNTLVGSTLTAGALTPTAATVTYQWQSSATSNGTYTNISGATNTTYSLSAGDLNKFIKVVATGNGLYTGVQTSTPTSLVYVGWIAGVGGLVGKFISNVDLETTYSYKTSNTPNALPQGAAGSGLVSPQANPGVDFSEYPAQNACKLMGGRLPDTGELYSIYANKASYGNNFNSGFYWSNYEYTSDYSRANYVYSATGFGSNLAKTTLEYVRCVKD